MIRVSTLCLLIFLLTSCRSIGYKYVTDEEGQDCCTMTVPIGDDERKVQISINLPLVKLSYSSPVESAKDLRSLDVKLFIDHKEIIPNKQNYSAAFFDAFRPEEYKPIGKDDCCSGLEKNLGFDKGQSPDANTFGVDITKTYEQHEQLPPNIEILVTVVTDQKTIEKRWKLKLVTYERIEDPIRFH